MKTTLPRWFWSFLAAVLAATVYCLCALHEPLWLRLGVNHLTPYFSDLVAVLAASDARYMGADPFAVPNYYDPFGRPHVYGPWWMELWRVGLRREDHVWLGLGLGMTTLVAVTCWLRPRGPAALGVAFALMASPAMLLGLERANNDLCVLLMLLAMAGLLIRARTWVRPGAVAGIVWLGACLKLYPLLAMPVLLERGPARRALCFGTISFLGFLLVWWWWREDFGKAIAMIPTSGSAHGFGLIILRFLWTNPAITRGLMLIGFALGAAGWVWLLVREWRRPTPLGWRSAGFVAGAWTWIFCYLASFNYGYRGILLLLPAGAWLAAAGAGPRATRITARAALGGLLLMLWLVIFHPWMKSDLTPAEAKLGSFLLGLEAGLAMGISAFLGLVSGRRAWRALRRAWRGDGAGRQGRPLSASR